MLMNTHYNDGFSTVFSSRSTLKFWDVQTLKWFHESVLERKLTEQKMQSFRQPERTWKPLFQVLWMQS